MKLISVNIQNNLHNKTILEFLKKENADVVCLQELLEEDFNLYKKELNYDGVFRLWRYIKHSSCPELIGRKEGIAIFAKNIVDQGSIFHIGKEENVLKSLDEYMSNEKFQNNNAFVWATVKSKDGNLFKIITTHIPVTKDGLSTPYQLNLVDKLLKKLKSQGEFILCGDMNAPRGYETFSRLANVYKDNIPLEYKTSLDQNLHRVCGLQLMVDGLFTTPNYTASNVKLIDGVSDHMAIIATITKK